MTEKYSVVVRTVGTIAFRDTQPPREPEKAEPPVPEWVRRAHQRRLPPKALS